MPMSSGDRWENASQSDYLTICGLAATLTFDILTSKFNQFVFVPNCTKVVNFVQFPQAVYKIAC